MPRPRSRITDPNLPPFDANVGAGGASRSAASDPAARDWSILGRRVLAEALRRTTDELDRRHVVTPASAVPLSPTGPQTVRERTTASRPPLPYGRGSDQRGRGPGNFRRGSNPGGGHS
jgi:hypothetical protein